MPAPTGVPSFSPCTQGLSAAGAPSTPLRSTAATQLVLGLTAGRPWAQQCPHTSTWVLTPAFKAQPGPC